VARLFNVTVSAINPVTLGAFWSRALGFAIAASSPELVRLHSGNVGPDMLLLRVDSTSSTSTMHLDLAVAEPSAEVARLIVLGARPVDVDEHGQPVVRTANGIDWYVMTDPEGNEFCIGGEPG
jgi:hypothetical protein